MQAVRTVVAIFGIVFLFPFVGLAQQTPTQQPGAQQPPGQQMPPQQTDLNDTQLRSFARAYVQIEKIRNTYEPQLKEAKTPDEGKQLQHDQMIKMYQALTQEGLDAQTYHRIVEVVNSDEALRQKVIGFINEERQKSLGGDKG